MFKIFLSLLFIAAAVFVAYRIYKKSKWKTLEPLLPACYNFGKRRVTFARVIELMDARNARSLVETGVARSGLRYSKSDGASTIVFALWAKGNGAKLISIDIDPASIQGAREAIEAEGLADMVEFVESDSVSYLAQIGSPVDFLYLDSYDYDRHDLAIQKASQEHHLKEFKAIENQLHEKSVVLIDDCKLPGGGKGRLVIDYMLRNGWEIDTKAYQVVLVRK